MAAAARAFGSAPNGIRTGMLPVKEGRWKYGHIVPAPDPRPRLHAKLGEIAARHTKEKTHVDTHVDRNRNDDVR